MIATVEDLSTHVAATLKRRVGPLRAKGPRCWSFRMTCPAGRKYLKATTRLERHWLCFRAVARRFRGARLPVLKRLHAMLRANAGLTGGVKLALADDLRRALLCAEIPVNLGEEFDTEERILAAIEGLKQGVVRLATAPPPDAPLCEPEHLADPNPTTTEDLLTLVETAGWPCTERSGGRLAVELEVGPDDYYQATLELGQAGLRVAAVLEAGASSAQTARAVCLLLLTASRRIRMARPYASGEETAVRYGWEVGFGGLPPAWELDHALAALSVALRSTSRESKALEDPRVAQRFLRISEDDECNRSVCES